MKTKTETYQINAFNFSTGEFQAINQLIVSTGLEVALMAARMAVLNGQGLDPHEGEDGSRLHIVNQGPMVCREKMYELHYDEGVDYERQLSALYIAYIGAHHKKPLIVRVGERVLRVG